MSGFVGRGVLGRRVTRRAAVRGGVLGTGGLAAFALACGSDKKEESKATTGPAGTTTGAAAATTAPEQQPKVGGEYRVGFTGPFAGVDPHNSVYGGSGIVPLVYNYLLRTSLVAPEKGIVQELAVSQELSADKTQTVFKLRPDAMIAENKQNVAVRAIDAEDAKLSFERVGDPKAASNGYSWINEWVDKFEAVDKTTFKVTTKAPYAWVLNNVGNNLYSAVVPKEWLASADIKKTAVGSGPFILQSLEEGGQAVMTRNPNHWDKGKPYIATYVIKAFADQTTYRTAFTTNQLETYGATNIDEAKEIVKGRAGSQHLEDPSFGFNSFWMNVREKPWDDPRIRKAVRRAVNPAEYIGIIGHGQGAQIGPITYAMKDYALPESELKTLMPYNVQEAKQLLQAAGQPNLTFKFQHPTSSIVNDYVNIFVRQMQAAGITAQPEPQDAGTWVAGYFQSKLNASLSLNQEYANPDFAMHWFATGGITGNNRYDTGFSDPEVDAAIKKAAGTIDEKERIKAYQDAQRLVISKDPPFFNFFGVRSNVIVAKEVVNYPKGLGSLGYGFTKDIWLNK
jgi:peptide/nickel transport system substrate-binding protein